MGTSDALAIKRTQRLTAELEYVLLPGRCPKGNGMLELHNEVFQYWRDFWAQVFSDLSGESVAEEDFSRQDLVCVLLHRGKIIGMNFCSFYHLGSKASRAQSYIQANYTDRDLELARHHGVHYAMSIEYLTVDPEARGQQLGFPVASVLIGLAYQTLEERDSDGMIAHCRRDARIDSKAADFGAIPLSGIFTHHNVPVINMVLPRNRLRGHPEDQVNELISSLWSKRVNAEKLALFPMNPMKRIPSIKERTK